MGYARFGKGNYKVVMGKILLLIFFLLVLVEVWLYLYFLTGYLLLLR